MKTTEGGNRANRVETKTEKLLRTIEELKQINQVQIDRLVKMEGALKLAQRELTRMYGSAKKEPGPHSIIRFDWSRYVSQRHDGGSKPWDKEKR